MPRPPSREPPHCAPRDRPAARGGRRRCSPLVPFAGEAWLHPYGIRIVLDLMWSKALKAESAPSPTPQMIRGAQSREHAVGD